MVAVQYQTYTVEEFYTLDLTEGHEYELVNGIVTPMSEPSDTRKPDLIAIDRDSWNQQTSSEAILKQPPSVVIEIVSTNWEEDYRNKPLWYAAFGVSELWIIDPLFTIARYPQRKNPKIQEPTISIVEPTPRSKETRILAKPQNYF